MKDMTNEQLIRASYMIATLKDPETAELAGRPRAKSRSNLLPSKHSEQSSFPLKNMATTALAIQKLVYCSLNSYVNKSF